MTMKKSLLLAIPSLLLATGCADKLTDYNIDVKNPSVVPATALFSGAERSLTRTVTSTSVNLNPFRLYVQFWAETTYPQESQFQITPRRINQGFWDALYTGTLSNLNEARNLVPNDQFATAKEKTNRLACIEIISIYTWSVLVNTYGNIPYTEALDFNNAQPKYDDAKAIYSSLLTRLDAAIASLDPTAGGMGNNDILYYRTGQPLGSDISHWIKFGNSLKLRLAMTIADDDPAKASTLVTQAAANVFTSNADQAQLQFTAAPPNTNPLWEDLVNSGRADFVGSSYFVNNLKTLQDPRLTQYFQPATTTGQYTGGTAGNSNSNFNNFSLPGIKLQDPTLPGVLLSYSEVQFLLAEAVERGIAVGGTAASHYNAGVTASITYWGGGAGDATTYLAQPTVSYTALTGTYKEKIGFQKWIALYDQPVQAWTEWRRLDSPALVKPARAISAIPLRFPYPTVEQNLNGANRSAAATAIGGDVVTTRIFWDKN
jgi:hypothetical protein